MVDTISREGLKEKMDSGDGFALVNVLSEDQFEQEHIPGSINIPLDEVEEEFPRQFDRDDDIVVYCASESCQASPKAAEKLESMGFTNVADYEGGLADWKERYETQSS
ncbi:MAG: rhodanese-like domain-containing protein [Candidatus Nanohaloarchaea archaeon]|nr:rhodanese-like domain-containing protein [Candidatus Nanohaloarchaea archaeon]